MLELLIVILLVLLNGFFALSEMAVVTSRKSRLKQLGQGSKRAAAALELAEHPESFLSAVQVWITLLGLLTGYFGGASLADMIQPAIAELPGLARYSSSIAYALSFGGILFVSVVLGELLPKRLGILHPEKVALQVALPMRFLSTLARPVVALLSGTTRFLLRLIGVSNQSQDIVTDEEIRHLVAESHEQGNIDADERNMLNRVLRLGDRTAESLMTPRTLIVWLDTGASLAENQQLLRDNPFSRYPVYQDDDSNILGILESKSLVGRDCGSNAELFGSLRPALYVSESTNALKLLEIFREEQQTIALVVDEYGDIQGLVSINDLIGAVLGRIQSLESTEAESLVTTREDGSWLVDGRLAIEDLHELLNVAVLPGENEGDFTTVAGMVIAHFGRIPHAGEYFEFGQWRVEVVDLDGARIDKLLVGRRAEPEAAFDQ